MVNRTLIQLDIHCYCPLTKNYNFEPCEPPVTGMNNNVGQLDLHSYEKL